MKRVIYTMGVLFILVIFSACNKKRTPENCHETLKKNCICPAVIDPVCGCNGITYGNSYEAECHGITDYTPGTCK